MEHSPGFIKIVNEARQRVKEITVTEARERLAKNPQARLVDVREDSEWHRAHAAEAIHIGKGVLERDLEKLIPDSGVELLMYCGGGFRSVLAADAAQKMGYHNVYSVAGGYGEMMRASWPIRSGD